MTGTSRRTSSLERESALTKCHPDVAQDRLFEVPSAIDLVKQAGDLHQIAITHTIQCTNVGFQIPGSAGFAYGTTHFSHDTVQPLRPRSGSGRCGEQSGVISHWGASVTDTSV